YGGEVSPEALDEQEALRLMLADPLLIRRPLMEVDGQRRVGFDPEAVERWIGLSSRTGGEDLETCPRKRTQACAPAPS
ncbi:MAG TPA: ArsC/Spx/MgsR family protein, partial [Thiobacillaceae bacterium]|nr:ArsC/Spx/MgsR family protein [Thiobacillaceae bacterium]HNA82378.1 ArsC/Spx/MgsR family protein [Thiobacillaceae bacterium]